MHPAPWDEDPEFYTTAPAARAAGISESVLRLWAREGLVPFVITSTGVRLFALDAVLRVAQERRDRPRTRWNHGR
jgi:DNA-binding transcriptional MerR regulator